MEPIAAVEGPPLTTLLEVRLSGEKRPDTDASGEMILDGEYIFFRYVVDNGFELKGSNGEILKLK